MHDLLHLSCIAILLRGHFADDGSELSWPLLLILQLLPLCLPCREASFWAAPYTTKLLVKSMPKAVEHLKDYRFFFSFLGSQAMG